MSFNNISFWTMFQISYNFPNYALFQNCINGSAPTIQEDCQKSRKEIFYTTSPEPLTQIQYNFTELFLMMHSTKISQMVPHHWSVILRWGTQGPLVLKSVGIITRHATSGLRHNCIQCLTCGNSLYDIIWHMMWYYWSILLWLGI